jgi:transketolase
MPMKKKNLSEIARAVRKNIITAAHASRSPHVGSCLSVADLLTTLYFSVLHIQADDWDNRDIFILSKAHAALALYAVLFEKGIISPETFGGYYQSNGTLPGHLDRFAAIGIEVSAGSLGHGFNMGLGMAHGYKLRKDKRKIVALIGDGESQEGSIWEGALFAPKLGLDNFTVLLDHNNLQACGRPEEICAYEPIVGKWKAFGWDTHRVNGHDFKEITTALNKNSRGKPKVIIADTIKGKGVSFMENELKWHYYIVTDEIKERALKGL